MSDDVILKIKSTISLSDVVSTRIALQKNGANRFKAKCPFHNEKTPSFNVDNSKGIYKCFGCGAGGDMFTFVKEFDKINDFKEVIKIIADIAGVEYNTNDRPSKNVDKVYKVNQKILEFFVSRLEISTASKKYITKRGITDEQVKKFQIGYAADSYNDLISYLKSENFSDNDILSAGIAKKAPNGSIYTIFRDRLMIPILDKNRKVIGFGGRALNNEIKPKYINSAESEIFAKSRVFYNIDNANTSEIIIAEGYMDVIALDKIDVKAIAPLGTSITKDHLEILQNKFSKITFWLDSDEAGQRAMYKSALQMLEILNGKANFLFVRPVNKFDPDEHIKEYGKDNAINLINNALSMHEFIWSKVSSGIDFKSPQDVIKLQKDIADIVDKIADGIIKQEYSFYFKNKIYQSKFKQSPKNNNELVIKKRNISNLAVTEGLIISCINQDRSLLECEEFDFDILSEGLVDAMSEIIENDEVIDLSRDQRFNGVDLSVITKGDDLMKQFTRLCVMRKIMILDDDMKKIDKKSENFEKSIKLLINEKAILKNKLDDINKS